MVHLPLYGKVKARVAADQRYADLPARWKVKGMRIGELAERSGVSTKTIRYYEDIGLVPPAPRLASGYRDYDPSMIDRLAFIRSAQAVGLSLGEIRGIVALRDDGQTPCGHVLDLLRTRSAELDRRIAELRGLRGELNRLVVRAGALDPADCDPERICHLVGPT
jgi:DNA-binding transcriptional MerR regulator